MEHESRERTLSSLKNALRVLKCFTMEEPEKGITEIARSLNLSKSSVHRIMTTLSEEGFVRKDEESRRYRLGLSVLGLSGVIMSSLELYREGQHLIENFANRFDEAVHLAVLEDYHTVYVSKLESSHPVDMLTHIGRENPLHCTSSGKAILAFQKPAMIEDVICRGLTRFTDTTITNPQEFRTALDHIRECGYATSHGELRKGIYSIAVPVRDYTREVIGAVTVVGPANRFTSDKVHAFTKQLLTIGKEISNRLGYYERRR